MSRTRFWRAAILLTTTVTVAAGFSAPASAAPPTGPRGPYDRIPGASHVVVGDDDLTIFATRADGGGSFAVYRTPPGQGSRLLAELRARGVIDKSVPAKAAPGGGDPVSGSVDPIRNCASGYGGARYWGDSTCNLKIRWRWNGYSDPQIYFRDHTPAQWPVSASVTKWHEAVGVDSYWTSGSCPGGGRHCVNVFSGFYTTSWYGYTRADYDSSYYFIDGGVEVYLNDKFSSSDDNRGTACHELGHALGLGHNSSTGSCLYTSAVAGPDPRYPDSGDYNTLRYIVYP